MSLYHHPARVLAALVLLGGVTYWGSLDNSFQYDDFHSIVENPHLRDPGNLPAFFADPSLFSGQPDRPMYRPVLLSTYALNHAVGEYRVLGYHVVNLGLHLLNAFLVYGLGRARFGPRAGWLAALLFLFHPLAAEPVNYISSRSASLAALFYLLALVLYLRGRQGASLAAYGLGLLTKSTLVTLPVLLLCWELWGRGSDSERRAQRVRRLAPFLVLSAGYLLAVRSLVLRAYGAEQVRGVGAQVLSQLKALVYYLDLLLLPFPLSVEHSFQASPGLEWVHLPAAALLLSAAALVVRFRARGGLLLGAAFLLPLLPASLVPLNVLVNEHRLYLPLAFGAVGLGGLLDRAALFRRPAGIGLVAALLILCGIHAALRTRDWQDELTLWRRARQQAAEMPRVHLMLGDAHRRRGDLAAAVPAYLRADSLLGRRSSSSGRAHFDLQLNLGGAYLELGDRAAARSVLEPLAQRYPDNPRVLYNLGLALREAEPDRARASFSRAFELDADLVRAGMELGLCRAEAGELTAAQRILESVVGRAPDLVDAWANLGWVRAQMGQYAGARAAWERALGLDPGHAQARANLEELQRLGQ